MNKDQLLKHIAETAYNIGFGAKKHFATYDMIIKGPGIISFLSFVFGIYALVFDSLNVKFLSATILIFGLVGIYISLNNSKKDEYCNAGENLTVLFNDLKRLYVQVKSEEGVAEQHFLTLEEIENKYIGVCCSHQLLLSNWYAHYKFFWEHQIDWIDEQLNFHFFRDKVPLSFMITVVVVVIVCAYFFFDIKVLLTQMICTTP